MLALDAAATEFYANGKYDARGRGQALYVGGVVELYGTGAPYPIVSIEDGMAEDDWAAGRR
jgi:enolase